MWTVATCILLYTVYIILYIIGITVKVVVEIVTVLQFFFTCTSLGVMIFVYPINVYMNFELLFRKVHHSWLALQLQLRISEEQ